MNFYGAPGERGESFNTACFVIAVCKTTGQMPDSSTAIAWLESFGYTAGAGGCHWFRDRYKAKATYSGIPLSKSDMDRFDELGT